MSSEEVKTCKTCQEIKPLTEFYINKNGKRVGRVSIYCKTCSKGYKQRYHANNPEKQRIAQAKLYRNNPEKRRLYQIKYQYGLSQEEYEALSKECAICGITENLVLDHNHVTGDFRDVLCRRCNTGLGMFQDDPNLLIRATDYILMHYDQRGL